jgi:hypothetical protein
MDKWADGQMDRWTDRLMDRWTDRHTDMQACRQKDKQANRNTDTWIDNQLDKDVMLSVYNFSLSIFAIDRNFIPRNQPSRVKFGFCSYHLFEA